MRMFGTVELIEGSQYFKIKADPHVVIRFKRVFPKVEQARRGWLTLANTPENCRELLWFCQRYPLAMNGALAQIEAQAERHIDHVSELERLVSENYVPKEFDLSPEFEQREYQRRAAEIYLKNRFLLLADDVGLGKTAVGIMSFTDKRTLPALVVTLTHLPVQWQREIQRFAPGIKTHILKSGTAYLPDEPPDVIISNYHKLRGWSGYLAKYVRSVIFDEVQELRRGTLSAKGQAAYQIADACDFKLGLTATPIYNYGGEFWNVIAALNEDALGRRAEFVREWCGWGQAGEERIHDPKAFGAYLRENFVMLRRTRQDVGRELPDLTRIRHFVDSDTHVLEEMQGSVAELARIILRQVEADKVRRFTAAGEFDMKMRQATGIAKAPYVADFVRLLVDSGESVVLYGWHREVYGIWQERLKGITWAMFTGSETPKAKETAKQAFLSGKAQVLMISLRAGAGMDGLQKACRTVVFGELDWSPGVHEQCIGRVYRDGQDDKVVAYYLVSDGGADPIMAETLGVKREQVEGVRNPDAPLVEKLDRGGANLKKLAESVLTSYKVK